MYVVAQFKRASKLFPAALAGTVILMLCLGALAFGFLQADAGQDRKQMVKIGMVGNMEDSYLGFGIRALQSLDSSRFAIEFRQEDSEETARRALKRGEISAYVLIPNGFMESWVRGDNVPVTYVTSPDATGIGSMVMEELVEVISVLVTESQHAIYSAQRIWSSEGRQDWYGEAEERFYLRVLDLVLGRKGIYRLELTGVSNGLSITEYYACGAAILFLLFFGVAASPCLASCDVAVYRLLRVKGLSAWKQFLAEYISYTVLLWGCYLVMALFLSHTFGRIFCMLPVVMLVAAMQLCVCEWIPGPVVGAPVQFLGAAGLGYLSGCFYPVTFFPEKVQMAVPFLPAGAAMRYAGNLATGRCVWWELAIMGVYGTGSFFLAVLRRKHRLAG